MRFVEFFGLLRKWVCWLRPPRVVRQPTANGRGGQPDVTPDLTGKGPLPTPDDPMSCDIDEDDSSPELPTGRAEVNDGPSDRASPSVTSGGETETPLPHDIPKPDAPAVPGETPPAVEEGSEQTPPQTKSPTEAGGRRGKSKGGSGTRKPEQEPVLRPELICRRSNDSSSWQVILSVNDERFDEVRLDGQILDLIDGECHIPTLGGQLSLHGKDLARIDLDAPLIFRMKKNWTGDGLRVAGTPKSYLVVIAPADWQRTGSVPREQEACADNAFTAHFFFQDENNAFDDENGFREYGPISRGFGLVGERIFDDSEHGELFVGKIPDLKVSGAILSVRVGEERPDGWKGANFKPEVQSLEEILGERRGRFFIRVYDAESKLRASDQFRYFPSLGGIHVNGEPYTERTVLAPSRSGHRPTEVRIVGVDGKAVHPILTSGSKHVRTRDDGFIVEPHPEGDLMSCALNSGTGSVDIVLNLPRIWWRMIQQGHEPQAGWQDAPFTTTRQEFRENADTDSAIHVRLPRWATTVRVGFDDDLDRRYRAEKTEDRSAALLVVPLSDFADHMQIRRRLMSDTSLNIECGGTRVTLVAVSADPAPEIVSFTSEPTMVNAGQPAALCWTTRNTGSGSILIDPAIGAVEPKGRREVTPLGTTTYTLKLTGFGLEDMIRTVTVTVGPLPRIGDKPTAQVLDEHGRWRSGKGFSLGELCDVGLTKDDAVRLSIRIDQRRRSAHPLNAEALRRWADA